MGNTCAAPNLAATGFLQSVSAVLWRTRPPEEILPPLKEEGSRSGGNAGSDGAKELEPSVQVQITPPETVKIKDEVQRDVKSDDKEEKQKTQGPMKRLPSGGNAGAREPEPSVPVQSSPPETVKIKDEVQRDVKSDDKEEKQKTQGPMKRLPSGGNAGAREPEPSVPVQSSPPETVKIKDEVQRDVKSDDKEEKRKNQVPKKSLPCAGLQIDSVLQRKTGNLKEIYSLGRKLGQGQFGTTYLCVEKANGKEFACKSIAKRKLSSKDDVEDVRREIQIMHHLAGHPNVISIVGAFEDAVAVHFVMELCVGGELFDRIIQRGHYTEKKAADLARVIVGVVEACHYLGVMHRDLKPENFLFINRDEESPLKTIDFGLSMFFRPGETFHEVVGSPYYVAPEVLRKHYGPECDVWSAGVIIYILLSGVPPFWGDTEQGIFEQVLKGDLDFISEPWPTISNSAKDLVRKMLVRDPKKRLTAHEVLCHPWVQVNGVAPDKPLGSAVLTRLKQFSAMNKLKKIAIRVIAESLSEEEIAGLKEMFKMIDADNSGNITLEELKSGLKRVGADLKDSEILRLMEAADIDNSGTIDYGEFVAAMLHLNKIEKEDHMYAAFAYMDKDGSGYITLDELQQACELFGLKPDNLEEAIREADKDNDGCIDYNEFVAMMQDRNFGKGHKTT